MTTLILAFAITAAQMMIGLAMTCAAYRMARGPRAQDRVLGLDTFYTNSILLLLTFGVQTGRTLYFEAAFIIALLGFSGTVALAKFLMRGEVIE
jgi:multicomponent K+:H+ antiporter subunit F